MKSTHSIHGHEPLSHELGSEKASGANQWPSTLRVDFKVILPIVHFFSQIRSLTRFRASGKDANAYELIASVLYMFRTEFTEETSHSGQK